MENSLYGNSILAGDPSKQCSKNLGALPELISKSYTYLNARVWRWYAAWIILLEVCVIFYALKMLQSLQLNKSDAPGLHIGMFKVSYAVLGMKPG